MAIRPERRLGRRSPSAQLAQPLHRLRRRDPLSLDGVTHCHRRPRAAALPATPTSPSPLAPNPASSPATSMPPTPLSSPSASASLTPPSPTHPLSSPVPPLKEATPKSTSLIIATTTVTKTGKVPATEVVQCYVGNRGASLEQPTRSLQAFTRITLGPGESKQLTFPLGFNELSFFDNTGRSLIEPTDYTVWIGGSSLAMNKSHFNITR